MNKEDYFKYYIQGSDHYLIPKDVFDELFDEMESWKQDTQKYKEAIEKAIKYIEEYRYITDKVTDEDSLYYGKDITLFAFNDDNVMELLEILKEVE